MKRSRLAALPLGLVGALATPGIASAADEPAPVDATRAAAPVAWRAIPAGASARGEDLLDVPPRALAAYQRAAAVLAEAVPECRLEAPLLAAIGKVESDHGRYGTWRLGPRLRMFPALIGSPVTGPSRPLADSDGGTWDRDPLADRPLGPLQILPSLWQQVAVDGDGDGLRSPHDLDDAALALGLGLCDDDADLSRPTDRRLAVRAHNDRPAYVREVEAFRRAYAEPVAVGTVQIHAVGTIVSPPPARTEEPAAVAQPEPTPDPKTPPAPDPTPVKPPKPTPTPTPTPTPAPAPTPTPPPVDPAPVEPAPVDPSPVAPAPVDPSPVAPAPVDPSPVDPTSEASEDPLTSAAPSEALASLATPAP